MRLEALEVRNFPPIELFEVNNLADVIVVAGPNGSGKTRLLQRIVQHLRGASPNPDVRGIVEATCPEERDAWGKSTLDMSLDDDMTRLQQTLQVNRLRRNWRSSLVNFESDRTIQTLQPLAFSFDMPDPEKESVSWDIGFGFMKDRFQDTVHSMFRMIEAQRQALGSRAVNLRREGKASMALDFSDPMEPFREVFSLLLAPKQLISPSARQQRLEYMLEGKTFDFSTLSSGEREVVNIAFDFLLRKPRDCIVFFDEPELHLHPELSYRLIQTLEEIGLRNQLILATHSADIISGSLDRTVIFITPPSAPGDGEPRNQAVVVNETDETNRALKLLGQSVGIIALGKRIVLIEGEHSSVDKQTYGAIIKNRWPGLVLVPSGGKHVVESFSLVCDAVLSQTIWGVDFFMLCDRDSAPVAFPSEAGTGPRNERLRILERYHLENYFLDEDVWAEAFEATEPSESWLRSPRKIREKFRDLAGDLVSYATALAVASRLRLSVGNIDLMPKRCHGKSIDELVELLVSRAFDERARVGADLDDDAIKRMAIDYYSRIKESLERDSDGWKKLVPGKPLLQMFAKHAGLPLSRAKALYLHTGLASTRDPFAEIVRIFEQFATANPDMQVPAVRVKSVG